MTFNVKDRTIYLAIHGSQAYGLATESSDVDVKGICIEPKNYYLGNLNNFQQEELMVNKGHPEDSVIYSIRKFFKLATDCNPNIIEVLFVDEEHIRKIDRFGEKIRENRDLFISKKALHTFSGYAHAQIKRIKSHRKWLISPPTHLPTREEFGLLPQPVIPSQQLKAVEANITKKLDMWNFKELEDVDASTRLLIIESVTSFLSEIQVTADVKWKCAARSLQIEDNFIEILDKERHYRSSVTEWNQYQNWLKNRNPARAEQERKFGYDLKHASHCLRLMRMAEEILSGKGVIVKRPDREELLAVKMHGSMSYDALLEETERLSESCRQLYQNNNTLPNKPPLNKIEKLLLDTTEEYLEIYG